MRNSLDDVESVVNSVGDTLDAIPDSVNVLSVFLALQIQLKAYIDTMESTGIGLPRAVGILQRDLAVGIREATGELTALDREWNEKNATR